MADNQINIQIGVQGADQVASQIKKITNPLQFMGQKFKELEAQARQSMGMFRMELLSLLFFGASIQRTFKNLIVASTTFFMKVTEGQTMAGQAITRLSAAWQFLRFTIGDAIATALLPWIGTIVDVIDSISEWVQNNKTLAASLLFIGLVVGSVFMAFGFLGLGLQGVSQTMTVLVIPAFKALGATLAFIGGGSILAGLAVVGLVAAFVALIAIIIGFIPKAREAFGALVMNIWNLLGNVFGLILDVFTGNFEKAGIRIKIISLQILNHFVIMAQLITAVVSGLAEAIVGIALTPLWALAKIIDMILNKLGRSSNIAGQVAGMISDVTSMIRDNAVNNFFGNLSGDIQTDINSLQGQLNQNGQGGGETVNINGDININSGEVDFERLMEEFRRRQGALRGGNL